MLPLRKHQCMMALAARSLTTTTTTSSSTNKVAVLGAAGGIGQPLSLLLKMLPPGLVSRLALYDVSPSVHGVAADVAHVDTAAAVTSHLGPDPDPHALAAALDAADVVVVPAGVPRKPGMTRDDLFNTNAAIVHSLAASCAKHCGPDTLFLLISNPINSTVPIFAASMMRAAPQLKEQDVMRRVIGVTALDAMRASAFVGPAAGAAASSSSSSSSEPVTVVGGHSGPTIVPLLSQHSLGRRLSGAQLAAVVHRIQYGGDEVVKAKNGGGSATLSMAAAAARFTAGVLEARLGLKSSVLLPAFVRSPLYADHGVDYFASNVEFNRAGVAKIHAVGKLSPAEEELLAKCMPELRANIAKGLQFAEKQQ